MSQGWRAFLTASVVPTAPVESAVLPLRQTGIRNGETDRRLSVVVDTPSRCQPNATVGRIAEEAKAQGNAWDMLTSARWFGG